MFKIILSLFMVLNQSVVTIKSKVECGYKQCPATRDGTLNVHLIPHSHMDAGWVKNFDDYYFGTKTSISSANVQLIYHSVLSELLHDKHRRFTFSESGYFWRWWKEQRPATRSTFRTLVQEGRIEFAGGGWVQNDEATADYLQIIDQFTWGLRKINDTIGPCGKPKAGWQIDTYGHTREQTSLLAQMGYDGLFIGRVDHKERETMIEEDRMEFMWRGSDVLGKMSDIMTHTLFNLYNAPEGFCFDFLCNDEPIVDDPDNQVFNADKRVNDFITQIEKQAKYYDHDNIVVMLGGDFTYQSAASWFMNIDKLINHVNTHPANMSDINIFYSTPSCYLKAIYLYGRRDKAVHTEKGDHLPYGSDSFTYWTGFYTSRPSLKYLARRVHIFLQIVKQLTVIARTGDSYELHFLRHAASLILHHDAITGTSQQHVTNDFVKTVNEAIEACTRKLSNTLSYLTPTWGGSRRSKSNQQFTVCHQLNMSKCQFAETQESMLLLVYNPSSVKTYHFVKLPSMALHYSIRDANDEEVEYQLVPLPAAVRNLPGRNSPAVQELCFEAENIPPLGYTSYYISAIRAQLEENAYAKRVTQESVDAELEVFPQISNEYIKVAVNKETGLLESIQHVDGVRIQVSQNFYFYGQGSQPLQSGAYSFRPTTNRPTPITERVTYNAIRGNLVKEIRQKFNDWVTQVIRLYRGEEFLEFEWVIGPVPVGTDLGKEVVSIFTTNISNVGEFYTDSNARQMMKRSCWNSSTSQLGKKPVPECYYPVTSRICMLAQNSSVGMCVLTDRPQGGTSYDEGQIELMVHRRLLTDDGFGLDENLNEEEYGAGMVVKGKHRIVFGNFRQEVDGMTFFERAAQAARRWKLEPWAFLTPGEKISRRKWLNVRNKRYSALRMHALPRHIQILTLEPWKTGTVLLRLENTLEKSNRGNMKLEKHGIEDKSSHISVDLRKLFLQLKIKAVRETTLAANQWLEDARQMDWSTRYVYAGGDEGLLPEDLDYDGDNKQLMPKETAKEDAKDSVPYSDEQSYSIRNKPRIKQRSDQKTITKVERPYEYERRKRSSNFTENISENIIHSNYDDRFYKLKTDFTEETDFTTTEATKRFALFIKRPVNDTVTNIDEDIINVTEKAEAQTKKSISDNDKRSVTKKLESYLTKSKISKNVRSARYFDWVRENYDEIVSSEEDLSENLKKRSFKRKENSKHRNPEIFYDDSDDGITKSIYEMYYRTRTAKPRSNPFKPFLRSSEEYSETPKSRRKHNKRFRGDDVRSGGHTIRRQRDRTGNKFTTSLPFLTTSDRNVKIEFKTNFEGMDNIPSYKSNSNEDVPHLREKRLKDMSGSQEDYDNTSDYEGNDDETERRRKRAVEKDDYTQTERSSSAEQPTEDYIVTLRPTQIRTFIITIVNSKKLHVI